METVNTIIMKPLESIRPYEKNPRRNSKTVELLVKIIPKVGFNVPIVIDSEGVIVKGHARYLAAQKLGLKEVPCVVSTADPESIKLDRIADNKVFEFSKWINEDLLHEVDMFDLDVGFDLEAFGLPKLEIADIPNNFNVDAMPDLPEPNQGSEQDDEARRQRFLQMMAEQEAQANEQDMQIVTQHDLDTAKEEQREEAKAPPKYFAVTCEKCGKVGYVKEGFYWQ